ncbi:hypothetical protein CHARACLAT_012812 [Characodon lateralis]|uniref:ZNRF-3 ectodomain domain-containing protein n=1 Tax=Characodon lateralis TaxID=208331 RepID=A0ABU7F5R7_9TELE|nr:hypothetical protein [Characodon lateralis]
MHQPFAAHYVNSPTRGCQLLMSPLGLFNLEISAGRVEGEARSHMKRLIGVELFRTRPDPKQGRYHPLSLCNTSEDERQDSAFITIVKLEHRVPRCSLLLDKGVTLVSGCYF